MGVDLVTVGVVCADVMVRPVESMPPKGTLSLVPQLELHLGGLAGVTAAVLCQLGGSAAVIGGVGDDGFGHYLRNFLADQGVDVSQVVLSSEPSSSTVVMIDDAGERTFLHQIGATATLDESSVANTPDCRIFHWGGPGITPGLDGAPMGRVMAGMKARGITTSMDTVYDGKGRWLSLIEDALPHLDIVMSSLEEARMYTGCESPEAIADFYRGYGPETVLIKMGGEGLFAKNGSESVSLPAHDVEVVDTTGAGDAACGGFLHGMLHGWDLERSARLANAVGGLTVQHMGGAEAVQSLDHVLSTMEVSV